MDELTRLAALLFSYLIAGLLGYGIARAKDRAEHFEPQVIGHCQWCMAPILGNANHGCFWCLSNLCSASCLVKHNASGACRKDAA